MITINNVHKKFAGKEVLRGVDLTINEGETLAIIGRSGCGKSVLLKHIVGLLFPDQGYVTIENKRLDKLSPKEIYSIRRNFGFLFQGAALFDSMTVEENISLPIIENNYNFTKTELEKNVAEKLEWVGLPGVEKLKPAELSGGMKKRVSLARSLITNPSYILYDEPTTGLDPIMSNAIDELIIELANALKVTSIVVTHDMLSVKNVAARVAMLNEGQIYFTGTPDELENSTDDVIFDFILRTKENV